MEKNYILNGNFSFFFYLKAKGLKIEIKKGKSIAHL